MKDSEERMKKNYGLQLEILEENDLEQIVGLYQSVIGSEGCVWDEEYPNREILLEDIRHQDLFGIRDEQKNVIAAIAKDRDEQIDGLACWSKELVPAAEFARLVVAKEYHNKGIARVLITEGMKIVAKRGYQAVHYLVAADNIKAQRSYAKLHFNKVGETELFGHHYLCYEKAIEEL